MEREAQCRMISTTCGHLSEVIYVCCLCEYNKQYVSAASRRSRWKHRKQWLFAGREESGIKEEIKVYLYRLTHTQNECIHTYLKPLTTHLFKACHIQTDSRTGGSDSKGLLCFDLPWPSCGWPPMGLFLPATPSSSPLAQTPLHSPLMLRVCQLEKFLPLPFHPSENCGLAGDQQPPSRKLLLWRLLWSMGPLPCPGIFATSLALVPRGGVQFLC